MTDGTGNWWVQVFGGVTLLAALGASAAEPRGAATEHPPGGALTHDVLMTREKYAEYVRRFNAQDNRFAEFYTEGVVFEHGPVFGTLHGRQGVVDFYRNAIWSRIKETIVPEAVVIDNEHGLMAVELVTHLVATKEGVKLPSHPQGMKVGDELTVTGVVIYSLKNGEISHIRDAIEGNSFKPAGS
jgi:hypothetical protein